jgi:hypothetical protein
VGVVADKYRGTTTYHLVFSELIQAAQHRGTTTYQMLASIMGLPTQGNLMGKEVGQILGEVSEDEVARGRPMLSAIVVNTAGLPGPGFFGLATDLGLFKGESDHEKREHWERTKADVYAVWQKRFKST